MDMGMRLSHIVLLSVTGCSTLSPRVATAPGPGKTPMTFGQDQIDCTHYADVEAGPAAHAYNVKQGTLVIGATVAGAAIGTAIHDPLGGVAAGAIATVPSAAVDLELLRRSYDVYYAQCMYAHGDAVAAN